MAEPLLSIRGLSKRFGGLLASDRIDLDVTRGETHAIIGPNGAGKTTLIGQLAGDLRPDAGSIRFAEQDVTRLGAPHRARRGVARSFQVTSIFRDFPALATEPRLLLLDEPVAGMGLDESQRMVRFLSTLKRRITIVLVEHDMDAVFTLADRISVMVYGRIIATGTPPEIRGNDEVRRAYLGEDQA